MQPDWIRVDCRELSKERTATVSNQLQQQFDEAAWHAPSIVCFDNLDRLCPAEMEVGLHRLLACFLTALAP